MSDFSIKLLVFGLCVEVALSVGLVYLFFANRSVMAELKNQYYETQNWNFSQK